MKSTLFRVTSRAAATAALGVFAAASGQADMIAGWDFSQYRGTGLLSTDGATFTNTLSANYSALDPTSNAGTESAAFGAAHFDGQYGSTSVAAGPTTLDFVPTAGSLSANLTHGAQGIGENAFDSRTLLASEGQTYQQLLAMTAGAAVDVVFEADLSSVGQTGFNWSVSFGGKTFDQVGCSPSCSSTVTVEFSHDGSSYSSYGSVVLDSDPATSDTFNVPLSTAFGDAGYVRLSLDPSAGQPIIDNVAVHAKPVPEPATALGLVAGVIGLWVMGRRRA